MSENNTNHPDRADFSNQKLKGKKFKDENLAGADFSGAELKNAKFFDCNLEGAVFAGTDLEGVRIEGGSLKDARMSDCKAAKIRMKKIDATGLSAEKTDFSGSTFQKVSLDGAKLTGCKFDGGSWFAVESTSIEFLDCTFEKLRAPDTKLTESVFRDCRISQADLVSTTLKDCRFEKTGIVDSDLSGARMEKVLFADVAFDGSELIACDFDAVDFDKCSFKKTVVKYSRGLTEETLLMIKENGGKIGLDVVRKASNFLFYTNKGRLILLGIVVLCVAAVLYKLFVPSSWSYEALRTHIEEARAENDTNTVENYNKIIIDKWGDNRARASLAHLNLGQIYFESNNLKDAETHFRKVLDLNKDDPLVYPEVYNHMGYVALRQRKFAEALDWFTKVFDQVKSNSFRHVSMMGKAETYKEMGQPEKALEIVNDALVKYKGSFEEAPFTDLKVRLLIDMKRFDEAQEILLVMKESSQDEMVRSAYFQLAQIERAKGNREGAEAIYKEMAARFPEAMDFLDNEKINKGRKLLSEGNTEEGEKVLKQVIHEAISDRTRRQAKSALATQYMYTNRIDQAEPLLKELLEETYEDSFEYYSFRIHYAQLKRMQGDPVEAIKILTNVLEERKGDGGITHWALQDRAVCYQQMGKIDLALQDMESAVGMSEDQGNNEEVILNLVQMAIFHAEPGIALKLAEKYQDKVQDQERKRRFLALLAQAKANAGDHKGALAIYSKLIDEVDDNPAMKMRFRIELIKLLNNSEQGDEAFKLFKEIAETPMEPEEVPDNVNLVTGLFNGNPDAHEVYVAYYRNVTDALAKSDRKDHNYYICLVYLADQLISGDELEKGLEIYQQVIGESTQEPPIIAAYENLFRYYLSRNDDDAAENLVDRMQKQITSDRGKVASAVLRSRLYARAGNDDKAIALLNKNLEICVRDMDCCQLLDELFGHYRRLENRDKMRALYSQEQDRLSGCWIMSDVKAELNL